MNRVEGTLSLRLNYGLCRNATGTFWVIAKLPSEMKTPRTQVLSVCSLIALHIKQRISIVDEIGPIGAVWYILSLTVSGYEEAMSRGH